jgi:hypothetical protein
VAERHVGGVDDFFARVVVAPVAEDAGFGWVFRFDVGLAADGAELVLIEVGGFFDVAGDFAVAEADAIDLDVEADGTCCFLSQRQSLMVAAPPRDWP